MITIMRKLMDALNMDNWNKQNDDLLASNNFIGHFEKVSKGNDELKLFEQIESFWLKNEFSYSTRKYREPTFKEKKDYALIDILSCFLKKAREPNDFSPLLLSELEILNWNKYFNNLIKKGYLESAGILEILKTNYTVAQLKEIADNIGVKKTGKKIELVIRILNSLNEKEIEEIVKTSCLYSLTEKGKEILLKNEDYILYHKHRHKISIAEFNDNRFPDGVHKRNFYDTMFHSLCSKAFACKKISDFNSLTYTYLDIYNILMEEEEKTENTIHYDVILEYYIQFLYLSSCFCGIAFGSVNYKEICYHSTSFVLPCFDSRVYILSDYEDCINYEVIFSLNPPSFLTNSEFKELVHEILNNSIVDVNKWNNLLINRAERFFEFIK